MNYKSSFKTFLPSKYLISARIEIIYKWSPYIYSEKISKIHPSKEGIDFVGVVSMEGVC